MTQRRASLLEKRDTSWSFQKSGGAPGPSVPPPSAALVCKLCFVFCRKSFFRPLNVGVTLLS